MIHTAGAPVGLVQECVRCGEVLVDNRGVHGIGPGDLHYFAIGASVEVSEAGNWITREAPTCNIKLLDR